jgi:beta-lactamase regulating signal transducer with metallopeptidase domain
MIFPDLIFTYRLRLVCLCLACFFLFHVAVGLLVSLTASWAIRRASRMDAPSAARFLLALRLLPAGFATIIVAGICAPSYLWLEPEASVEEVGLACMAAALLGLIILAFSMARGLRASRRSLQYIRHCQRVGRKTKMPGEPATVWIVNGAAPLLALTGIVRPRLVISQPVVSALSSRQLAAVLRHEHAHRLSHDNLKRLVILLSPGLLPFFRGFDKLEQAWARFTEWAADDRAVDGDGRRSLSLAAALIRVARLGAAGQAPLLATGLLADSQDLSARVDRLLHPRAKSRPRNPHLATAAVLAFAALLAAVMLNPATLSAVHQLLERLIVG